MVNWRSQAQSTDSTTVYVLSSELGLSQPLSRQRVCPSPRTGGGGHTRLRVRGWGSSNSDDWRKSLVLCLLCGAKGGFSRTCKGFPFKIAQKIGKILTNECDIRLSLKKKAFWSLALCLNGKVFSSCILNDSGRNRAGIFKQSMGLGTE